MGLMKYVFKMMAVVLALGVLVLQGSQTTSTKSIIMNYKNDYICSMATKDFGKSWSYNFAFRNEAKKRGLTLKDCTNIFVKNYSSKYSIKSNNEICLNAVSIDKKGWSKHKFYSGY